MKTEVRLKSKDRNLFGVVVEQNSKTGFLSITDLMSAYEKLRVAESFPEKRVTDILKSMAVKERIYATLKELNINDFEEGGNHASSKSLSINDFQTFEDFHDYTDKNGIVKTLKRLKVYKEGGNSKTGKRISSNPYIWVLLALEMNPKIYAKTIVWLTDGLLVFRNGAGDSYKEMCKAVVTLEGVLMPEIFIDLAKMLNYIVFNKHQKDIRNDATTEELRLIEILEKEITMMIEFQFVKTKKELIDFLKKLYSKHQFKLNKIQ